jgi:hypothetical protein
MTTAFSFSINIVFPLYDPEEGNDSSSEILLCLKELAVNVDCLASAS